jgi:multidrug efflux pump subunit AcrA (membrane-fusion protein)
VIPSKVRTVIPTADRQKATVKVRISFTAPDHVHLIDPATQPRILPDMGVKVTFLEEKAPAGKKTDQPAIAALIPQDAVRTDGSAKVVFVVNGERLERRAVSVGNSLGGDTEILAGLVPGDNVVVKGPADLRDGQTILVKK